jgi:hypothetical protein
MVAHQAPGVHLPVGLLAGLAQGLEKHLAILRGAEDRFAMVATVHHMINRAQILHSELPCHHPRMSGRTKGVKCNSRYYNKNRPFTLHPFYEAGTPDDAERRAGVGLLGERNLGHSGETVTFGMTVVNRLCLDISMKPLIMRL